jgi:predicted unusual protein kinase regulating ubiquinone biosynthesis (AarF/ABC1/UbiB family)
VYRQYSTSEVLVLEYAPGVKVNDGAALERMGLDRQRVAKLAVESYLQQILRHGFFHVSRSADSGAPFELAGRRLSLA